MASDKRPSIAVQERAAHGSRAARRLRRSGQVPGILYGGGNGESLSFAADARELRHVLVDGSALFDVQIGGGKTRPVIIKDQQLHPVRDELMHIDLLEVRLDEKIHASVAVELAGGESAPGVKEGGVLEHVTRELQIEALPTDIPESIVADVSGMEVAGTLTLAELEPPTGVAFLDEHPEEITIATVVVPTEIEEPEEVEEETGLVGEEAGAEGATGEEAAQADEAGGEENH